MPAMDKTAQAVSLWDAIAFLGPLIGGGGITAIVVAWFGTKKPKAADEPVAGQSIGIQALLADHFAMERFTNEVKRMADALEDQSKAINRMCDLLDISRAVQRLRDNDRERRERGG
jgi:hypothetical protein